MLPRAWAAYAVDKASRDVHRRIEFLPALCLDKMEIVLMVFFGNTACEMLAKSWRARVGEIDLRVTVSFCGTC